jgi:SAM-dependent methyltransferase
MLQEHLEYLSDSVRLKHYQAAIAIAINAGDTVVDLGCGTGVLGMLCLRRGASRAYEIESTAIIEIARDSFDRAGLGGQVRFVRGRSTQVELPELGDVVISDQVGYFGFDYGIVAQYQDARRRFLRPNGRLIPDRLRLFVALAESEESYRKVAGWALGSIPTEFAWLRAHAVNWKYPVNLESQDMISAASAIGELDLHIEQADFFKWSIELVVERNGTVHGLCGWFECRLAPNVWMTNSPFAAEPIDRPQAFFPTENPIDVIAGDLVVVTVMARPEDHLIAWKLEFRRSGLIMNHSTWQTWQEGPHSRRQRDPLCKPRLNELARARQEVLAHCNGARTATEIEEAVCSQHPDLFPSHTEISRFVAQVLSQDTKC